MRVPFPIAHLVRRARNAKGAKERHDTAFFAWEASVRLAVAAQPPADSSFLQEPSTGAWLRALKLAGDSLDDLPLRQVSVLFASLQVLPPNLPQSVKPRKIVEHMGAYRNEVYGHGATRTAEFYDPAADILLGALDAAWARGLFWPDDAQLVYVESIELGDDGARRARVVDLSSIAPMVEGPREGTPVPHTVSPRRLYLRAKGELRSLHPWLLYQEAELRERVLFFNGRRRGAKFLDYVGGEVLKAAALDTTFPNLEKDFDIVFGLSTSVGTRSAPEAAPSQDDDPSRFGDYEILGKLGEGGMGVVYAARQQSLGRITALKVIHAGASDDARSVARFKREIAALARCDHPNIVSILDSGDVKGTLYYAMEFVDGADLAEIAADLRGGADAPESEAGDDDEHDASRTAVFGEGSQVRRAREAALSAFRASAGSAASRVRKMAVLFRDAARAVHYLHGQGMIHRDIKPANLMITAADHRIVLMDLGLVALGDASRSITRDKSSLLGTLRYMPPEQLTGNASRLDARADVYSLGATFYELFTGRPFFDGDNEARLVQQVIGEEPAPPEKGALPLPPDLCTILRKTTLKDPNLRYATAEDVARDIDAWLNDRPISARPPTLRYMAIMAAKRNKAFAAFVGLAVLVVFVGLPLYAWRESRLRVQSDRLRAFAETQRLDAQRAFASVLEEQGRQELVTGYPLRALTFFNEARARGNSRSSFALMTAQAAATLDAVQLEFQAHSDTLVFAAFAPGDKRIATASDDRTVKLWDAADGRLLHGLEHADSVRSLSFSNDGATLLTTMQRTVTVWNVEDGAKLATIDTPSEIVSAAYGDDARRILVSLWDGTARVYDVQTKELTATIPPSTAETDRFPVEADWTHDGSLVVIASAQRGHSLWEVGADGKSVGAPLPHPCDDDPEETVLGSGPVSIEGGPTAAFDATGERVVTTTVCSHIGRVWDTKSRKQLFTFRQSGFLTGAFFGPGSSTLYASSSDGRIAIWDATNGRLKTYLKSQGMRLTPSSMSPDGKRILTRTDADRVVLWDAESGTVECSLDGHKTPIADAALSNDGMRVLTASEDGAVKLWSSDCGWKRQSVHRVSGGVAISPDGARLLSWDVVGATLIDPATARRTSLGARPEPPGKPEDAVNDGSFGADGDVVVTAGGDKRAKLWKADTGELTRVFQHDSPVLVARLNGDGTRLLTGSKDHTARVWNVETGDRLVLLDHAAPVDFASFSPDEKQIVTRTDDGVVKLWDMDGKLIKTLPYKVSRFSPIRFSQERGSFVALCEDGAARVWDASGKVTVTLKGVGTEHATASLSPDGTRVITAGDDGIVRIWDAEESVVVATLKENRTSVRALAYSPDGQFIVTGSEDGGAWIWDADTGKLLGMLGGHQQPARAVQFAAQGTTFFTVASEGMEDEVIVWPLPLLQGGFPDLDDRLALYSPWTLRDGWLIARPRAK